jgi:hypothetical protein
VFVKKIAQNEAKPDLTKSFFTVERNSAKIGATFVIFNKIAPQKNQSPKRQKNRPIWSTLVMQRILQMINKCLWRHHCSSIFTCSILFCFLSYSLLGFITLNIIFVLRCVVQYHMTQWETAASICLFVFLIPPDGDAFWGQMLN